MDRLLNTREGRIMISVIWGLGLAFLFFKQTCKGDHCVVYSAPPIDDITKNIYSQKDNPSECYVFKAYNVNCEKTENKPIKKIKEEFKSKLPLKSK
jgi:hypothetical protein